MFRRTWYHQTQCVCVCDRVSWIRSCGNASLSPCKMISSDAVFLGGRSRRPLTSVCRYAVCDPCAHSLRGMLLQIWVPWTTAETVRKMHTSESFPRLEETTLVGSHSEALVSCRSRAVWSASCFQTRLAVHVSHARSRSPEHFSCEKNKHSIRKIKRTT